jgi:hypothetical protein
MIRVSDEAVNEKQLGMYDENTDIATVYTQNMDDIALAVWTAWHELYHRGARIRLNRGERVHRENSDIQRPDVTFTYTKELKAIFDEAVTNPLVSAIAAQMTIQHGISGVLAIEEAMVEIGAARQTKRWGELYEKYGVVASPAMRKGVSSLIDRFIELVRRVMGNPEASDARIIEILKEFQEGITVVSHGGYIPSTDFVLDNELKPRPRLFSKASKIPTLAGIKKDFEAGKKAHADSTKYKAEQKKKKDDARIPESEWWKNAPEGRKLNVKEPAIRRILKKYNLYDLLQNPKETAFRIRSREIARHLIYSKMITRKEFLELAAETKVADDENYLRTGKGPIGLQQKLNRLLNSRVDSGSWVDLLSSIMETLPGVMDHASKHFEEQGVETDEGALFFTGPEELTAVEKAKRRFTGPKKPRTFADLYIDAESEVHGSMAEAHMEGTDVSEWDVNGAVAFEIGKLSAKEGIKTTPEEILHAMTEDNKLQSNSPAAPDVLKNIAKALTDSGKKLIQKADGTWEVVTLKKGAKSLDPKTKKSLQQAASAGDFNTVMEALRNEDVMLRAKVARGYLERAHGRDIRQSIQYILGSQEGFSGEFSAESGILKLAVDSLDVLSTAFHESFHRFVVDMRRLDGGKAMYKKLAKAASAPHVVSQMKTLLAGQEEALAQLNDPEERMAYMYQFWAASLQPGGPTFNIQKPTKTLFQRITRALSALVGRVRKDEAAEGIFNSLYSGQFATGQAKQQALEQYRNKNISKVVERSFEPLKEAMSKLMVAPTVRLKETGIPALIKLARLQFREPKEGGKLGLLQVISQIGGKYRNDYVKLLNKHQADAGALASALSTLQSQQETTPGTLADDIRVLFKDLFKYSTEGDNPIKVKIRDKRGIEQWVAMKELPNFFPRIWSITEIQKRESEFRDLLSQEGGMSATAIDKIILQLKEGDGMEDQAHTATYVPAFGSINPRVFDFITSSNAALFAPFQEQDMTKTITKYIRQTVHRREHSRIFGHDGQGVKDLLESARKQGATSAEIDYAKEVLKGMEGRLGTENMTNIKRNSMVAAMTAVNFAVLPLATFTSLVDPLGVFVRTGSLKAAGNTFAAGIRQIINDTRKVKTGGVDGIQVLAEYIGAIEHEMMLEVIGNVDNGMFMNDKLRKLNNFFFKAIGLEQWTRGTRIGALQASLLYLRDNATNSKALKELNLKAGDIELLEGSQTILKVKEEDFLVGVSNPTAEQQKVASEKAQRIQAALFGMVDEAILRPSAATRPLWMSDIRFIMLGHLKQFAFTYHNTISKQVINNFKEQRASGETIAKAALVFLPLLSYIPAMMGADVLRSIAAGKFDDDDDDSFAEYFVNAIQRSGVTGYYTFGFDLADDLRMSGLPIGTLLGPVAGKTAQIGKYATDGEGLKAASEIMPFNALVEGYLSD